MPPNRCCTLTVPLAAGKYSEHAFQALDYLLDEASKYGIRLLLSLGNNWDHADSKAVVSCQSNLPAHVGSPHRAWDCLTVQLSSCTLACLARHAASQLPATGSTGRAVFSGQLAVLLCCCCVPPARLRHVSAAAPWLGLAACASAFL